jgi:hypothetical protein
MPFKCVCEDRCIAVMEDTQDRTVEEDRLEELLTDAGAFFESHLWESATSEKARVALAEMGLDEEVIRAFGVGYAPVGPDDLMDHLLNLGYSIEEVVAAGLATRSVRGRAHTHFRSRVMFPVKDADGRILGFAGLGTHVGPSWALWTYSPDVGLYRRSEAVFGLDRAAGKIATSGTALVLRDCIEVLKAHQDGGKNAVAVHTPWVTRDQMLVLANGVPGGLDALELDLPPGMQADAKEELMALPATPDRPRDPSASDARDGQAASNLKAKRVAIVIATALTAVNLWTGAPLLAVWLGAQAQGGRVLSLRGVVTVLLVLSVFAFVLGWALAWLSAKYDQLIGRPPTLARTSPWQRRMRGELDEHLRTRYSLSAPERVVAACVIAGVLGFEIWFFFLAGSSLPNT